ncbi:diguanylate cyclase [Shewanella sp. BF02_Schw]|jgi:diguanylate cyclase (GGDEF)-like protein|uniref:sensor domain-containing diguanylate cyclase n=2 Tax=unclassified Shewanella TaxID=196818 RepID=UPI00178186E9|nr:sensor domain-containing diguanylate cyclase [Shewanella sp. BF02_Schw]MBO1894420.1 diguanylate cyclase [Shewanella sp. BF02_Schw]
MFHSIKAKVITIFSLVMIAFTSVLLITIFINERDRVLDLALENSTKISKMHANLLSQEFARYVVMLKMLSNNPKTKLGDKATIARQLQRLMTMGRGNFINAIYVDKNLNLTDVLGNTNKVTHSSFIRAEQWVGKEYNISTPVITRFEKAPVIMVGVPILDTQNNWIGTLAVAVPLTIISAKLAEIKLAKESYAWLTDSNGLMVSHPNKSFIMKNKLSMTESADYPGFYKIVRQTKLQNDGYGRYRDAKLNESKIVTFSKVDYLPGWTLFVTTKESEIFHAIYTIMYDVLVTSIILMVIFLLLISELSNRITKPIVQLTKDVKASVKDKKSYLKIIDSDDEIGQLSKAFHDSLQKIHLHTIHLEQMVNHRTQEITDKNLLLNQQNEKLEQLASKDPLTLLYNRRAFSALVDKEISRAKRHHFPVTLVILDIDYFKKINDEFGHNVGDDILCRFADELSINMRKENLICRWGGEEFVILIPEATSAMVFKHIEELRQKISQMDFAPIDKLTFSAGMATLRIEEPFKEWFQRADSALYKAKGSGRNKIVVDDIIG